MRPERRERGTLYRTVPYCTRYTQSSPANTECVFSASLSWRVLASSHTSQGSDTSPPRGRRASSDARWRRACRSHIISMCPSFSHAGDRHKKFDARRLYARTATFTDDLPPLIQGVCASRTTRSAEIAAAGLTGRITAPNADTRRHVRSHAGACQCASQQLEPGVLVYLRANPGSMPELLRRWRIVLPPKL